jgi:hypothetical protein
MVTLEYLFKKYGKNNIINYIRDYHTTRINENMTIDKIIYTLDSYGLLQEILNHYKNMSDNTKYINFGEYFIK